MAAVPCAACGYLGRAFLCTPPSSSKLGPLPLRVLEFQSILGAVQQNNEGTKAMRRAFLAAISLAAATVQLFAADKGGAPQKESVNGVLIRVADGSVQSYWLVSRNCSSYLLGNNPALTKEIVGKEVYVEGLVSKNMRKKRESDPDKSLAPSKVNVVSTGMLRAEKNPRGELVSAYIEEPDGGKCMLNSDPALKELVKEKEGETVSVAGVFMPFKGEGPKDWKMRYDAKTGLLQTQKGVDSFVRRKVSASLPEEKLKPSAVIDLELPDLGTSVASNGKSLVQMEIALPENYSKDKPMPVILYSSAEHEKALKSAERISKEFLDGKNFIVVSVDYSFEPNVKFIERNFFCMDQDYKNALYALQVLDNSTEVDMSSVVFLGVQAGAFSGSVHINSRNSQAFSAFCFAFAGLKPRDEGKFQAADKPILFIFREGFPDNLVYKRTVSTQKECMAYFKQESSSSVDSLSIDDRDRGLTKSCAPEFRSWLYNKVPGLSKHKEWALKAADESAPDELRALCAKWLSESPVDYPLEKGLSDAVVKFRLSHEGGKAESAK